MNLLSELIERIETQQIVGNVCCEITHITADSRKVQCGSLFVAIRGTVTDGHTFLQQVVEQGVSAVVCEVLPQEIAGGVTYVQVQNTAKVLGEIASAWNGYPSEKLKLVGVTGTNGKTTIATLLYKLFTLLGYKTGLLSTVCNYVGEEVVPSTHTTPDPLALNDLLAKMVSAGCSHAFMEVSSHSIDQYRIAGLQFDGGVFTNLTRDHLDYHKTFDCYLKAKKRFFDELPKTAFALTNMDDKNGLVMLQNTVAKRVEYTLKGMAEFKAKVLEDRLDGMLMQINDREICLNFVGQFNAYNLLAVYGSALLLGEDAEEVLVKMSLLRPVSGRFETIHAPAGFTVIVDYAHTPDALNNVLSSIQEVLQGGGRVITVVGAGGNRDKGKRPLMAAEAIKASDKVIFTSDNPRFEEPQEILNDMMEGVSLSDRKKVLSIADRREAIRTAIMLAHPGDVLLIAGKGHEDYQEIKGVKYHFDDKEEVLAMIQI